jgi:hypothetical protein
MTDPTPEQESEPISIEGNRTAVFLADGRVSPFLITDTIDALIEEQKLEKAILDLSTKAGITLARHLNWINFSYSVFDTEPLVSSPEFKFDIDELLEGAEETLAFEPDSIVNIDAGIVLIPMAALDGGAGIDASEGTITSILVPQLQEAQKGVLMILPPELGLRRQADETYVRAMLQLRD